jgi:hypothetical protein
MVEAHLEEIGRRGIAGDMAAQFAMRLVGAHHHGQGIPAVDTGQARLQLQVAREGRFVGAGDGIQVGRIDAARQPQAQLIRMLQQAMQHIGGAFAAIGVQQRTQGVAPFGGFDGIAVDGGWQGGHVCLRGGFFL